MQAEELTGLDEFGTAGGVMNPKMADTGKTFWEDMHQERANEVDGGDGAGFTGAAVAVVEILKRDLSLGDIDDAMVADGNAVNIPAEIIKQAIRPTNGRLDEDLPVFRKSRLDGGLNGGVFRAEFEFFI